MPVRPRRLAVEALEDRSVPAVSASVNGAGLLTVNLSAAADQVAVGGQFAAGTTVSVAGPGFAQQNFPNVTAVTVTNTSGVTGSQALSIQDAGGTARVTLTGAFTATGINTVVLNNPVNPLTAASITITGGRFITSTNSVPQLASNTITLAAAGAGPGGTSIDVIGTAANPIRIVPGNAPSLAADTFAGAGNQYYDFGGGLENVNGGSTGIIRAGTGTVTLTNGQFFGAGADDFGNNSTFNLPGNSLLAVFNTEVVGGLTGTGRVRDRGGVSTIAVGNNGASSTFAGTIQDGPGTLGLRKQGAGDFTLAGANTYTGATTVTGGRLLVNGSIAAGSAVTVSGTDPSNSTFLGGSGTIGGPVLVQAGAVVGPGDATSTATLRTGSLSFQPGGAFGVKIGGSGAGQFDALAVTGAVTLTNGGLFAVPAGAVPAVGSVLTVIANDGADAVTGTFAGLPEGAIFQDAAGNPYSVSYVGGDGNDVTLTARSPGAPLQAALLVTGPTNGSGTVYFPTAGQYAAGTTATLIPGFGGETHVALGDVNGDRVPDIVAATGPGGSRVRVLDGATGTATNPVVLADFDAFPGYAGGVFVAVGDLNGDGRADVAVTPDAADAFSGPVSNQLPVRVYSGAGFGLLASFDGLASLSGASGQNNAAVKLGGRPAIADVNGDGVPDLLIAAGNGGGPRITAWSGTGFPGAGGGRPTTNPIANLFVFESTQRGGAFITAGDVNGDGFAEVIVGGGPGGGPRVRVVNSQLLFNPGVVPNLEGVNLDDSANLSNGLVLNNFFAGSDSLRGGVRVAVRDADGDRLADVVVGSGTNELSGVRVYRSPSLAAVAGSSSEPAGAQTIDPFGAVLAGGVWIG